MLVVALAIASARKPRVGNSIITVLSDLKAHLARLFIMPSSGDFTPFEAAQSAKSRHRASVVSFLLKLLY
jgi:hypothetical protein